MELSTGFDLLWVFVRESRALKAVLRTAASSCLRTANPGSIARRVRSIPPSPRKKRAREALFFRGESSWSLSPSAGGASETARRSSRQAKRCGCRNNPASGKAASRKGSARLRAIPSSPLTKRTVRVLFSRRNKSQTRAPFRQEASLNICFLFDLEIFNDLYIDLMREVTAYSEEELAFRVMPDVVTDVIRNIAVHFIITNGYGKVLTIIIGVPDI